MHGKLGAQTCRCIYFMIYVSLHALMFEAMDSEKSCDCNFSLYAISKDFNIAYGTFGIQRLMVGCGVCLCRSLSVLIHRFACFVLIASTDH